MFVYWRECASISFLVVRARFVVFSLVGMGNHGRFLRVRGRGLRPTSLRLPLKISEYLATRARIRLVVSETQCGRLVSYLEAASLSSDLDVL